MGITSLFRRGTAVVRINVVAEKVLNMTEAELYETQPSLRAVVSFLADNVAQLPLKAYVRVSDTDRRRDGESEFARLLRTPGADVTEHELMRDTCTDYLLYNWALWLVLQDGSTGSGWSVTRIPVEWIESTATVDGMTVESYTFVNPETSKRVTVRASDCVRFGGYGVGGPLQPSSPIRALKQVLSEQISAWSYRNGVWRNGGRVSSYITRPKDAPLWSPDAKKRFAESWKARFSGNAGTDTGGTPLLEDGMELKTTQFNAREAQWIEATKLSREDVAAVYHVNPSLIWHTDGQTYASAKDNARALYNDTLAPLLNMFQEKINSRLVAIMGADPRTYVEFDMAAKVRGSFEERAGILTSLTGRPLMLVDEARAELDLPPVAGGDELCVPLNVALGGLSSPNDTDPTAERWSSAEPAAKEAAAVLKSRGRADAKAAAGITDVLRAFFRRQSRSVLAAIDRAKGSPAHAKADGDWPDWWNAERWDSELAEDLFPLLLAAATSKGRETLRDLGIQASEYDEDATVAYLRAMALGKARSLNNVTYRQLSQALEGEHGDDAAGSTPKGVFEKAEESRSSRAGLSFATAVSGWATLEAARQRVPSDRKRQKTWVVTSANPRAEHAAMNGETVAIDEEFSNGAMWPGDQVLTPEESCNCQCEVEITIG